MKDTPLEALQLNCSCRAFFKLLFLVTYHSYNSCCIAAKTNFPLRDYEAEVEEYKMHISRVCGHLPRGSTALLREAQAYTLPRDRVASADEKKRAAIIYGESLRQALED